MARDKEKTRSRLLDVATEVLGEHGFGSTSVDEIAEKAGVAKGTVYYHFASKVELVEALIAERLAPLADLMRDAAADTPTAIDALGAIVRAELAFIRDNRQFAKLLITELWREDRMWRESLMIIRERIISVIREQIERGIAGAELRADLDPGFAAAAVFALTATAALDWLAFDPERSLEEVAEQIGRLTQVAAA